MGIQKINKYLNKIEQECNIKGIEKAYISKLSGMTLAVDTYMFIYKALYGSENNYLVSIVNLILKFKEYDIKPIFVFDGKPPKEKQHVTISRKTIKNKNKHKIKILEDSIEEIINNENISSPMISKNISLLVKESKEKINKLSKRCISVSKKHIYEVKTLFNTLDLSYIHLNYEADVVCSELVKQGYADAVLSNDMDLLAYNCPIIIRELNLKNNTVLIYNLSVILNNLNLTNEQITQLIVMLGCDYSKSVGVPCDKLHELLLEYTNIEDILSHIVNYNLSKSKTIQDKDSYIKAYHNSIKIFKHKIQIDENNINNSKNWITHGNTNNINKILNLFPDNLNNKQLLIRKIKGLF